jgi:hypothetical protein
MSKQKTKQILEKRTAEIVLTLVLIALIAAFVGASEVSDILDSGSSNNLVAEYRFDTGAGDTAYDTAGDKDGEINGAKWSSGVESKAMQFDGDDDYVKIDSPEPGTEFTISLWIKPYEGTGSGMIANPGDSDSDLWFIYDGSDERLRVKVTDTPNGNQRNFYSPTGSVPTEKWSHIALTVDEHNDKIAFDVDGERVTEVTDSDEHLAWNYDEWFIGKRYLDSTYFKGVLDNYNVYDRPLNASQVKSLYNSGSWKVGTNTEEDDPSKVLDISFQHQNSSNVLDTSGYDNHLGITNGVGQENAVNCKVGSCYSFDGNNGYLPISGYSYESDRLSNLTVSAWIKTNSDGIIASFDRNQYWRFEIGGNGGNPGHVGMSFDGDGGQVDGFGSTTQVADGKWHHVAFSFGGGEAKLFVDGREENSTTSGTTLGTGGTRYGFIGVGSEAEVFDGPQGPNTYFDGRIDEFQIFNRSLSQQEIIDNAEGLSSGGKMLYMRFDRRGGDKIHDYSGEGNHGDLLWNESWGPKSTLGVSGNALEFDGYDDRVEPAMNSVSEKPGRLTVSAWYKTDGDFNDDSLVSDEITTPDEGFGLRPGSFRVGRGNGNGMVSASGSLETGAWTHVLGTYDNSTVKFYKNGKLLDQTSFEGPYYKSLRQLVIGYNAWRNSNFDAGYGWKGEIDEVEIYPYAVSEQKAENIYSRGKSQISFSSDSKPNTDLEEDLILSQTFDRIETCDQADTVTCPSGLNGEVAVDDSGMANHGELVNGPAEEGAGRCKVGGCLSFDGVDDYINIGDQSGTSISDPSLSGAVSFSAWVQPEGGDYIISSGAQTSSRGISFVNRDPAVIELDNGSKLWRCEPSKLEQNKWTHVSSVWNGSTLEVYYNGKLVCTDNSPSDSSVSDTETLLTIGSPNNDLGNYLFDGSVDQIRIYNSSLSKKQVWKLYTKGRDRSSEGDMGGPVAHWRTSQPGEILPDIAGENDGRFNTNLLDNSGFESGEDGTGNMHRIRTNYAGNSEVNQEESKSGYYGGKHVKTGEDDQWSAVEWDLTQLESGKKYDFGAWYKCTGTVSSDLSVGIANSTGWDRVDRIDLGSYTCDNKWRFVSGESSSLPSGIQDTNRVRFRWDYSTNSGTMYVDDMYLREDDADWGYNSNGETVMEFDGEGDFVQLQTPVTLNKEASTIAWRMNPSSTSSTGLFTDSTSNVDNHIEVRTNKIFAETQINCNNFDFNQYRKKTGWNSYAIVFDDNRAYLYENGELLGEATNYGNDGCSGSSANGLLEDMSFEYIGSKTGYNPGFNGQIDDVRVYPYSLDQENLKQVMNNGGLSVG